VSATSSDEDLRSKISEFWTQVDDVRFEGFEDAKPCLEALVELGLEIAVSSGGSQRSVDRKLADASLAEHVVVALGSDSIQAGQKGLPHFEYIWKVFHPGLPLDVSRIVFVGDTEHDMSLARGLGVLSAGISRDERLLPRPDLTADIALEHLTDLPALIGRPTADG
jgi:phosphoglycolate phosphatase-like HAD superfamily hydrolase